jgi:hypothetical protein
MHRTLYYLELAWSLFGPRGFNVESMTSPPESINRSSALRVVGKPMRRGCLEPAENRRLNTRTGRTRFGQPRCKTIAGSRPAEAASDQSRKTGRHHRQPSGSPDVEVLAGCGGRIFRKCGFCAMLIVVTSPPELTGSPGCSSCQRCGAGRSAVHLATHAAAFPWFLPCQPWARSAACSGQWTNDERR